MSKCVLEKDESLIFKGKANYGAYGGELYLTNKSLRFVPFIVGNELKIDRKEIETIITSSASERVLMVRLQNEKTYEFLVVGSDAIVWKSSLSNHGSELSIKSDSVEIKNGKTNGFAIAGFICSLVSLFLTFWGMTAVLGLVFSRIGYTQIKERGELGEKYSVAGMWIGFISLIYTIITIWI